ncbi:hypothetical protein [Aeoliella sp. SH292]|uniref:hypothetical protein n=1 Tax=Aeoliella sp. SH292 TaxID=3454464 RepID=UPI003F9E4CDF
MNTITLHDIAQQLENEKAKSATKANQLRTELTDMDDQIARLDGAISALRGTAHVGTNGKTSKKTSDKRKVGAPAASRAQVADLMAATLQQKEAMQEEELKVSIEEQLVRAGFNRMGYSLRFKEALADARFVCGVQGIELSRRTPLAASRSLSEVADDDSSGLVDLPRTSKETI